MALIGKTNEEKIWNCLMTQIKNPYGVAGLMGNLRAESALNPKNLENKYSASLGMSDEEYTKAVDNGTYTNFVNDKAGYGLAQWTSSSRKQILWNFAKNQKTSIGDLEMQLKFLCKELLKYPIVVKTLKEAKSVREASDIVLIKYERPANQSESVKIKRENYGLTYFNKYNIEEKQEETKATTIEGVSNVEVKVRRDFSEYINSKSTHYLSNSGHDENKTYRGGKAGDQTGKEWQLRNWYSRPWTHMFRYEKDPKVGTLLAQLGCAAALNDNIGYDNSERTTYWSQLKKVGYDPSKITIKCEEDCSAGVAANVKAAGYLLKLPNLQNVSTGMSSRNTVDVLTKAGFTVYTDEKYLTSGDYLLPGDILLCISHHVSMNITKGKKATQIENPVIEDFKVIDTATSLTAMFIREAPNSDSKIYGTLAKDKQVEVIAIEGEWLKIKYENSPTGYAYTNNTDGQNYILDKTLPKEKEKYITTVLVNTRQGAGTNYPVIKTLPKGYVVEYLNTKKVVNGTTWLGVRFNYKNKIYKGCIAQDYLKKV